MTTIALFPTRPASVRTTARPGSNSFWGRIALAFRVAKERRTLADMDPRMLEDIGLTPDQAELEATRALWDLPSQRHY